MKTIEENVRGLFWTRQEEMVEELERIFGDEAYAVCDDYITFELSEDVFTMLHIERANRIMWIGKIEVE